MNGKAETYPKLRWRELDPEQLRKVARDLHDHAHDMGIDREEIVEVQRFDLVGGLKAVARRLERRAKRLERETPTVVTMENFVLGGTFHVRWEGGSFRLGLAFGGQDAPAGWHSVDHLVELVKQIWTEVDPHVLSEALPKLVKLERVGRRALKKAATIVPAVAS